MRGPASARRRFTGAGPFILRPCYFGQSSAKVPNRGAIRRCSIAVVDAPPIPGRNAAPVPPPLPDESLDDLVTVLDSVRLGRARSRADLVAVTGLSRGVVAGRVADLLERGLITEGDPGPSTGGRPPRLLTFRGDAGHLLVADLGATSIDVAVTTLDGRILAHIDEPADIASGPDVILGRVDELFGELRTPRRRLPGRLWGVGIGVPGPVEFRAGRPISPSIMPGWDDYPVRERFASSHGAPVWVDNDVNVLALGEWRAGVAAGHDNVVVVKIGTGIGAGIIGDGRLHRGAQGSAGDVGHIHVSDDRTVVCRCGNTGCLEALAGGEAIGRDGEAAARAGRSPRLAAVLDGRGSVTAQDVAQAASFGDPVAVELLQVAGRRVGLMLASIVNFFNPSLVVIGGGVALSGDVLLAAIREVVYGRGLPLATRDLLIQRSSLGSLAGVIGGSAMVVDQLFARESLARWVAAGEPAGMPDVAVMSAG